MATTLVTGGREREPLHLPRPGTRQPLALRAAGLALRQAERAAGILAP